MTSPDVLGAVLAYARAGLRVFPTWGIDPTARDARGGLACRCRDPRCPRPGKHPLVTGAYHAGTTDAGVLRGWWSRWPWANPAIATGGYDARNGRKGYLVIDVDAGPRAKGDGDKQGPESLAALERRFEPLPRTLTALTGNSERSQHLYLRVDRSLAGCNTAGVLGDDLDVRVDGGYVLAPPALHTSGRRYAWDAGAAFGDIEPADAPAWLLALLTGEAGGDGGGPPGARNPLGLRHLLGASGAPIPEGRRNETLYGRACAMRAAGLEAREIFNALRAINFERCGGELGDDELARIARSAAKHTPEAAKAPGERFVGRFGRGAARAARAGADASNRTSRTAPTSPTITSLTDAPAAPGAAPPVVPGVDPGAFARLAARAAPAWFAPEGPEASAPGEPGEASEPPAEAPAASALAAGADRPAMTLLRGGGARARGARARPLVALAGGTAAPPALPPGPPSGGGGGPGGGDHDDDTTWQQGLRTQPKGGLRPTSSNAELVLRHHVAWSGALGFDDFAKAIVWLRPPPFATHYAADVEPERPPGAGPDEAARHRRFADHDLDRTLMWFARCPDPVFEMDLGPGAVQAAVLSTARDRTFDPLRDYLLGLRWDGRPRLARWLPHYLGARDDEFSRFAGERFLRSAVARGLFPGCLVEGMLVFESRQRQGKSFVAQILGGPWYTSDILDVADKDGKLALQGNWIVELEELKAVKGAKVEAIKKYLTQRKDKIRPPFGKMLVEMLRRCVFIGTTNDAHYLVDHENQRFWPVVIGEAHGPRFLDLIRDRDQLFAEAVHQVRAGAPWIATTPAERAMVQQATRARLVIDQWDEDLAGILTALCERREPVVVAALFGPNALNVAPKDRTPAARGRIVGVLQRYGWRPTRRQSRLLDRMRLWLPPTVPPEAEYDPAFERRCVEVFNRFCPNETLPVPGDPAAAPPAPGDEAGDLVGGPEAPP